MQNGAWEWPSSSVTKKKKSQLIPVRSGQEVGSLIMMKIKCWISGSASDAGNNNNNNRNATKKAIVIKSSSTTTTTTEKRQVNGSGSSGCNKESPDAAGGGAAAAVAGVVAKMRPTSLNVNQLNYNVVDLKKFVR